MCREANDCIANLCPAALCALIWPMPAVACLKACWTEASSDCVVEVMPGLLT